MQRLSHWATSRIHNCVHSRTRHTSNICSGSAATARVIFAEGCNVRSARGFGKNHQSCMSKGAMQRAHGWRVKTTTQGIKWPFPTRTHTGDSRHSTCSTHGHNVRASTADAVAARTRATGVNLATTRTCQSSIAHTTMLRRSEVSGVVGERQRAAASQRCQPTPSKPRVRRKVDAHVLSRASTRGSAR